MTLQQILMDKYPLEIRGLRIDDRTVICLPKEKKLKFYDKTYTVSYFQLPSVQSQNVGAQNQEKAEKSRQKVLKIGPFCCEATL